MKKNNSTNPVKMEITFELPKGHSGLALTYDESGQLKLVDKNGSEVKPVKSFRTTHFDKPKKRKYQTVIHKSRDFLSIGGLKELSELDSFFVIDTNTDDVGDKRVSVSFFIRFKLIPVSNGYQVINRDSHAFIYEFHDVPKNENPEKLAMLKLANDILNTESLPDEAMIWFINDCDFLAHHDISVQKRPIYGKQFLPKQFSIIYASSDTGSDAINQLFRICDKRAKGYLDRIKLGTFGSKSMQPTKEDPNVLCSCHPIPIQKFSMDTLTESTGTIGDVQLRWICLHKE